MTAHHVQAHLIGGLFFCPDLCGVILDFPKPYNGLFILGACKPGRVECAKVAELVDALDLGSSGGTRESSSLSFRTII